ncbi:Asp-tRNA(Asn)/Glu-tRNA(Gln) amidotransferase subunit GatA [Geminisphaera colitermitum]|uniref:Asp-tRNA(Asn)/Glu-tRNA(Gln) amidotransferase subunit GatA n=1 Tax=Geminisphaera colitermitum TaxID=1148786 RepID=UPI0001965609|nr:Asp-tRNA(Asn)/Glu-tRNA(Gln) amidotransferase subunit GatA [Geminisphaera colitermitum]
MIFKTITALSAALAAKQISSVELTQAVIDRTNAVEPKVNAFNSTDPSDALAQAAASDARRASGHARGPLDGIPIAIKDVIAVKDQPLTASSKILANYISPYDATVIQKLRHAGAVIWGRLNLDELAMGSSTENSAFKTTSNPYNLDCVPGGSSGGSAAAVAAGEAIATLGSDTGGSIRQPAALCNVVGMKPTYGLVSRYGLAAFASSLDQIGPFARTVEDAAILLQTIAGHDPHDSTSCQVAIPDYRAALHAKHNFHAVPPPPPRRLGIPKEYFGDGLDPEVGAAVEQAIAHYKKLGYEIRDVSLPHTEHCLSVYYIISTAECSSNLARLDGIRYGYRSPNATDAVDIYSKTRAEGFGPEVKRRVILGTYVLSSGFYDAYYLRAQKVRTLIRQDFQKAFEQVDAIVTPTSPTPAFRKGERSENLMAMYLSDIYTIGANLAGIPGISIPCGFSKAGLPIGLQLLGQPLKETDLFTIAHDYDAAHDWSTRRPNL